MRRLGNLAVQDFLESVRSLARLRVRNIHQMHVVNVGEVVRRETVDLKF
jgi:hypothetical protein